MNVDHHKYICDDAAVKRVNLLQISHCDTANKYSMFVKFIHSYLYVVNIFLSLGVFKEDDMKKERSSLCDILTSVNCFYHIFYIADVILSHVHHNRFPKNNVIKIFRMQISKSVFNGNNDNLITAAAILYFTNWRN